MTTLPAEIGYTVEMIPNSTYQAWCKTAFNLLADKLDKEYVQKAVLNMLKKWIRENRPDHKLCAFEELTMAEAAAHGLERGFYIKLRLMNGTEKRMSDLMRKSIIVPRDGKYFDEDPQFILEFNRVYPEKPIPPTFYGQLERGDKLP
jgi:hypothetical protein